MLLMLQSDQYRFSLTVYSITILTMILTQCSDREWISQNEFLSLVIQEPVPDCLEWLSVWDRVDRSKKGELYDK